MKKTILILLILLMPLALAEADVTEIIQEVGLELQGKDIPSPIDKIFGDERINIHLKSGDETTVLALVSEEGKVKSLAVSEVTKPTLNVYTNEVTIEKILRSVNPLVAFNKALSDKDITYKAVGFVNKFKFMFVNLFLKMSGSFTPDAGDDATIVIDDVTDGLNGVNDDGSVGDIDDLEYAADTDTGDETFDWEVSDDSEFEEIVDYSVDPGDYDTDEEEVEETEGLTSTTHTVELTNTGFGNDDITISVGDTVVWKNIRTGSIKKAMMVGTQKCRAVKSSIFNPGEQYEFTFTEPQLCIVVGGIYTTNTMKVRVE